MKKTGLIIAVGVLALFVLAGCGKGAEKTENGVFVNEAYADKKMVNLAGEPVNYDNSTFDQTMGMGVDNTLFKDLTEKNIFLAGGMAKTGMRFVFYDEKVLNLIKSNDTEKMTQEEIAAFNQKLQDEIFDYAAFVRIPEDGSAASASTLSFLKKTYKTVDTVTTLGEDTYYFAWNEKPENLTLTETDKENLNRLIDNREGFKNSLVIFPAGEAKAAASDYGNMHNFSAKTLDGGTFTQEDLKAYDITMVNVWATWCGYCIKEMPALQALYAGLPENVNMITIVTDAEKDDSVAKQIIAEKGGAFKVLIPDSQLKTNLLAQIGGSFPTTVFVDRDGNIVGKPQVGVPARDEDALVEAYTQLINDALETTRKAE